MIPESTFVRCFDGLASTYQSSRPAYSKDAISAILDGLSPPIQVADIGCGTGISSRMLAERGAAVIGIDPNNDMLSVARSMSATHASTIDYRQGRGEQTGLASDGVDLLVCAQSFHWFEAPAALAEFHRILKPGGRLALMWNVRDDSDPMTARYSACASRAEQDSIRRGRPVQTKYSADPSEGGFFQITNRARFANGQSLDLDGLLNRARSASYFPKAGPLRDELDRDLAGAFADYQIDGRVELRQFSEVTIAHRV